MAILSVALEAFLAIVGVLIGSYVVGEIVHLYNEKQRNQSFTTAVDTMSKSTVIAVESIKDTTTTAINALLNMDTLRDVNSLAQQKAKDNAPAQTK